MPHRRNFLKHSLLPAGVICFSPLLTASAPLLSAAAAGRLPNAKTPSAAAGLQPPMASGTPAPRAAAESSPLSQRLKKMNKSTAWNLVKEIKVQFKTFHCQGMVKIGDDFWVSSVEIPPPAAGGVFDRTKGAGHLFKIDATGKQLADLAIGEGSMYHPSGIDFDGTHIYIAAAEYRPDSQAIIYKVDPTSQQLKELFRWKDHIGGIARNSVTNTLHGISWGSRRFYQWQLDKKGEVRLPLPSPAETAIANPSFYIDYQDNQYLGGQEMLYTGLSTYKRPGGVPFTLGGVEIVDLEKKQPAHQLPIQLWSPATGAVMTQNPSFFELAEGDKIRAYFMPDDNESTIFVYEA